MGDDKAYVYRIPTGWGGYTLEQMWEIVRHETGAVSDLQYDAWRRMAQICNDQAQQLDAAVARLTEKWPAHPGSASEAFSTWVRGLTDSIRASAAGALKAQQAIMSITTQLSVAKGEIAGLIGDRNRYERDEQLMIPQPTPSPGETPRPVATAAPPDGWREMITQHARETMAEADRAVTLYAASLQPMAVRFSPFEVSEPVGTALGTGGASGSVRLPLVPMPPMPSPPVVPPSAVGFPGPGNTPILTGGPTSPLPVPTSDGVLPMPPILASQPIGQVPFGGLPVGTIGPTGLIRGPGGTVVPGGGRVGSVVPGASPAASVPAGPAKGGTGAQPAGMMPMAPMVPPAAGGASGRSGAAPGGRAGSPGMGRRRTDPNDPWAVREGAPAVLEPPAEPASFDPGPGVIGIDR